MLLKNLNTTISEEESSSIVSTGNSNSNIFIPNIFKKDSIKISKEDFENMIKIKRLDSGQNRFGKVYHYLEGDSMFPITCIKIKFKEENQSIKQTLLDEIISLSKLHNNRITRIYGTYFDDKKFFIFREFIERGSVLDKVVKKPLEEDIALKYFRQACEGLDYLHKNGIVHGNIQASNLLITVPFDIKISDYGLHVDKTPIFEQNLSEARKRMTLLHMAPELYQNQIMTPKSDIWALGCTLVTMLTQNPPFYEYFEEKSIGLIYETLKNNFCNNIEKKLIFTGSSLIPSASNDTKKLFDSVMMENVIERPYSEQILNTPFMKEHDRKYKNLFEEFFECQTRNRASTSNEKLYAPRNSIKISLSTPESIQITEENGHSFPNGKVIKKQKSQDEQENDFILTMRFLSARFFMFSILLLKWIGLVSLAAVIMTTLASLIFIGIFFIYAGIQVLCQCELAEGFIALITIILLPILILLTTLCCSSACGKYKQAVESGEIRKSRFYVAQPEKNLNLFGFKIIEREKKPKRKLGYTSKRKMHEEEDITSPALLSKGKLINNIAELA